MFVTPHIPFLINRAALRVDRDADGHRIRIAELALVLEPFPYELAHELDFAMAEHLYDKDREIRPELEDITLDPRAGLQRVTVAAAPDAPLLATLTAAKILDLAVTKRRDDKSGAVWLKATITVKIDLGERAVREFLFHHFGELRLFTFLPEQHGLPIGSSPAREFVDAMQRTMSPEGVTSVEVTTTDERGRRVGSRITKTGVEKIN